VENPLALETSKQESVKQESRDFKSCEVQKVTAANFPRTALEVNDLVMSVRGTIGKIGLIPTSLQGANITANLIRISPHREVVEPRFLWHFMRTERFQMALNHVSPSTTIKTIRAPDLKAIPIPLPPLEEQRRIAAILDKADAVRRKRQQAIALTEELLRSAFLNLVSSKHPAYHEWTEVLLADLALPTKGSTRTGPFGSTLRHSEFVKEGIAVLGIDNAVQNRFTWSERRFITPEKYKGLQQYTVKPGDVIITIMGTTGRSAVVPQDIPPAITTKHLATITLDRSKALPEYVSNAIHRDPSVLHQIALQNRGAIMAGLNLGIIKKLKVRLPPLEQQILYDKVVIKTRQEQKRLEKAANTTSELFNSLLQRAFRGEL
jgi:type I restriction enzyme S subunit